MAGRDPRRKTLPGPKSCRGRGSLGGPRRESGSIGADRSEGGEERRGAPVIVSPASVCEAPPPTWWSVRFFRQRKGNEADYAPKRGRPAAGINRRDGDSRRRTITSAAGRHCHESRGLPLWAFDGAVMTRRSPLRDQSTSSLLPSTALPFAEFEQAHQPSCFDLCPFT